MIRQKGEAVTVWDLDLDPATHPATPEAEWNRSILGATMAVRDLSAATEASPLLSNPPSCEASINTETIFLHW
jgi:hypothetical protein